MRRIFPRGAFAAALLVSTAAPALAEQAPSYAELLRRSLPNAPALLEQAANVRAARGDARQARAWRNPTADAVFENLAVPQDPSGVTQRQTTYTVTQPFEIGGKRAARIEAGERGVQAAEAQERQARIAYAGQLAIAYATAEAAQDRARLTDEDLGRANEDLRAAQALVKAGKEADLRVAQAQASVAAAMALREAASADLTEALERLSALTGASEAFTAVGPSLLDTAAPIRATVGPNLEVSPAVATAAAEQRALAAQVRIEEKKPIPDVGLSAGLRRYQGVGDSGLVVGVSATIPLFDWNRGGIEAARERAAAGEARLTAAKLQANADRRSALAQVTASDGRLQAATEGERAAAEAYRLGRIGYDAGKTSLIELLTIRRALTEARNGTIDARLARVRALAALAQADGRIAFGE